VILQIKEIKNTKQKFVYIPKSSDLVPGDYVSVVKVEN